MAALSLPKRTAPPLQARGSHLSHGHPLSVRSCPPGGLLGKDLESWFPKKLSFLVRVAIFFIDISLEGKTLNLLIV